MNRSSSLGRKAFGSSSFGGRFEPLEDRKLLTASPLINEIYFDPPGSGGDNNMEYIELRGTPGMSLDNHYLIFVESEDNILHTNDTGKPDIVFDLTGTTMGSNGFLILKQAGSPYSIALGTTQITYAGKLENSGFTAMLIKNNGGPSSVPTIDMDLDVGNNGLDVPTGNANWEVLDSIGIHSEFGEGEFGRLYAPINFGADDSNNVEPGATYVNLGYEVEYVARWGNSTGSTAADWHISNLTDDTRSGYIGPDDLRQSGQPHGVGAPGQIVETNKNVPYGTNLTNTLGAPNLGPQVVDVTVASPTVAEGNAGTTPLLFTVSLSAAAAANVTVQYATANGTATTANNDYGATSGTLTFTPGQVTQVITVLVNGDAVIEPNETFALNLSAASANAAILAATGTGTITNDDVNSATIVTNSRKVFYNQSKFDGNTAGVSTLDDNAIATDKSALLPGGGQATFANITSYTRGINGIMVDIQGTHGTLTASDFIFKVGANNTPSLWASPLETPTVTVRTGAGTGGSDRVEIIFSAANAPKNQWLQVVVKGNDTRGGFNTNTGLATSDIFFFGNRVGDDGTGTAGQAITSFLDENAARAHGGSATITNVWDYDRTGLVSATDGLASRFNAGNLAKINIANPPAAPEAAPAVSGVAAADSGIASALAAKALPQVDKLPGWITNRLASLDLNSGPIGRYFTNLAENGGPRATAILKAADTLADKLGLDDSLLDDLLAGLKK